MGTHMEQDAPEALIARGHEARRDNRSEEARVSFSRAIAASKGFEDRRLLGRALTGLAQAARDLGRTAEALAAYEQAAAIYVALEDPLKVAHTTRHIGDMLRLQGLMPEARRHYEQALALYRDRAETCGLDLANALRGFALLCGDTGQRQEAEAMWLEAKSLYLESDVPAGVEESDAQLTALRAC